jgi:hypothetical protein
MANWCSVFLSPLWPSILRSTKTRSCNRRGATARSHRGPRATLETKFLRPETQGVHRRELSLKSGGQTAETIAPRAGLGNLGPIRTLGNHVDLRGLPGGAEGIRTPDLCSAIAALSQLSYSPVARVFTCASDPCQRGRRGGLGLLRFNGGDFKSWENSCARFSTS